MTIKTLLSEFRIPFLVFLGIVVYIMLLVAKLPTASVVIAFASIILGSYQLFTDTYHSLLKRQFALDYIAILAIVVSLLTREYLVGMVIALMIASGRNLEAYGVSSAKRSLTKLIDRIPREVFLWQGAHTSEKVKIENIHKGQHIFLRKGEVIPLDGLLVSQNALIDESSLTGEPYPVEKSEGDIIRSGTINAGEGLVLEVTAQAKDSTYRKIIDMVQKAQGEKAPLVRLADKYSTYFTLVTFVLATIAYLLRPGLESVLAVLVVATPCPLILATPIALLGGVNAAAKRRIIVKKLASLEVLARVNAIIFDKTGTITLGKPKVTKFQRIGNVIPAKAGIQKNGYPIKSGMTEKELLSIAEAIERSSLHPLAKAVVDFAKERRAPVVHATDIHEVIGKGISGKVEGKTYTLSKIDTSQGMEIGLYLGKTLLATFLFEDEIKQDSKDIVAQLEKEHITLSLFTGDKKEAAKKVASFLDGNISIKAECTPEDKQHGIEELKRQGKTTAMVGDGINDAPALALADVGMVFSNEEQTAASEAADIVFLGGNFVLVKESLEVAKNTLRIAMQSILWGIGLSILAMIAAAFGLIPPIWGAILQEGIDVAVILNALRAAR